ncbi:MAG: hypothetical protein GY871_07605 [Actinomycetales bacterium]|nr:hypothetical protein [Actinomycetales bacterium]
MSNPLQRFRRIVDALWTMADNGGTPSMAIGVGEWRIIDLFRIAESVVRDY